MPHPALGFSHAFTSHARYQEFLRANERTFAAQRGYERALWGGQPEFEVPGFCAACNRMSQFKVDLKWGDGQTPNWRERLVCSCGFINRTRASLDFLACAARGRQQPRIYLTEQLSPLYRHLKTRYGRVVGSEYLRDRTPCGQENLSGIRHEDLTQLTFGDGSFDIVLTFDVLEHVPNFVRAFQELARVLAPGGCFIASFPFDGTNPSTVIRATMDSAGNVTHHLPPEHHGDPVNNATCLCFQVYGFDVLDFMRQCGFAQAWIEHYWSADRGYLGGGQVLILGRR